MSKQLLQPEDCLSLSCCFSSLKGSPFIFWFAFLNLISAPLSSFPSLLGVVVVLSKLPWVPGLCTDLLPCLSSQSAFNSSPLSALPPCYLCARRPGTAEGLCVLPDSVRFLLMTYGKTCQHMPGLPTAPQCFSHILFLAAEVTMRENLFALSWCVHVESSPPRREWGSTGSAVLSPPRPLPSHQERRNDLFHRRV